MRGAAGRLAAVALALVVGAGFLSSVEPLRAAPEPSIVPVSWELNFTHTPIERLTMTVGGKQRTFWYLRYTVTNNSGRDILFTPDAELQTDTGEVISAFKDVPNEVFAKVKEMSKDQFLLSPTDILGKLLQGEDNAKDGVLIFTAPSADSRNFEIFVEGLSGETAEVKDPISGKTVIVQKTLELDYNVPGEAIGIAPKTTLKATTWVMK